MNDISADESTDEEEINKNFETEAQLIVETDTLLKKSVDRYMPQALWRALQESQLSALVV